MVLTVDELARLKKYLRIDEDEEDDLLETFYRQAKAGIRSKIGQINLSSEYAQEQYDQALALLVQHWNDNREAFRIGNNSYEIPHSLDSILRELRYCYPPVEEGEV
ncbi:uncharacterized phage protein (possible DNA packaging) [Gracilibacillus orientalis]|uniref:Uncharacterized phage protein (Possible DNA packaging) n=1 Tax=Gracilibacillus orientalis TaxID=334253 RepID=A0A1I4H9F4_9BACI|nr:head-tail connector protein [Gracilibacillus orientalis]SFL38929.1 uncharacterized phage protein (possible DNA packaging) [Gracilibacillus orientalis]